MSVIGSIGERMIELELIMVVRVGYGSRGGSRFGVCGVSYCF